MILKIQRPLEDSPDPGDEIRCVLVYGEDGLIMGVVKLTVELALIFGSERVLFCDGDVINDRVIIRRIVEDRGW